MLRLNCVVLVSLVFGTLVTAEPPADRLVLFDGKTLEAWVVEGNNVFKKSDDGKVEPVWKVANGLLLCQGKGYGFGITSNLGPSRQKRYLP